MSQTKVQAQGTSYHIHIPTPEAAQKILQFNGRTLVSGLTISLTPVERKPPLEEIFSFVAGELKVQEESNSCAQVFGGWNSSSPSRDEEGASRTPQHQQQQRGRSPHRGWVRPVET